MKARITALFAAAIVALALAVSAVAAPHQNGAKTWSHQAPGAIKTWSDANNIKGWSDANNHPSWPIIGFFGLKTWSPAAVKPGTMKQWTVRGWTVRGWTVRGWGVGTVKPWTSKSWSVKAW